MRQEEILQYNKRCAEFLGAEIQDVLERIYIDKMKDDELLFHNISVTLQTYEWNGTTNIHYIPFDMLSFHSDWNWIMEVKNHIIGLGYCWFQFPDTIQINENSTISSKSICKVRFHKLQEKEAVVEAINQFLIWYENNMIQEEIKIENKPIYCNAWTSNISDKVMCNTIPCCGYCVHGRTDKVLDGFTAIDKIGKHQAPYYNDIRKEKNK